MAKMDKKMELLKRRAFRVRKNIKGTSEKPRLRVIRSSKHIYAQLIDDIAGHTLASASSVSLKISGSNIAAAKEVGKSLGERAKALNISLACFDRGGHLYHGRVKALADAAREAGLQF
ncbi:MAG: 50S ribosomal protein L18 [Candidatus Hydrogenedentes bacterium]|jgi:large subunit ribosomal protein L18|nr:50S ribosomal protein L18 [Candidatus Hydrogenedentota bacterium]